MCVSPIRIRNPNFGNNTPFVVKTKDTKSLYINVPCGVCTECLFQRQMHLIQRVQTMLIDHYPYFCTLTYNSSSLPFKSTSTGFNIYYADIKHIQDMVKRIRRYDLLGRPLSKYIFVTERGTKKGRPHVHGLIFLPKFPDDSYTVPAQLEDKLYKVLFKEWRVNFGSSFYPLWKPLFTYCSRFSNGIEKHNFECHYITPHSSKNGVSDVGFYVTKYILKPSNRDLRLQQALRMNLSEEEYEYIWSIVKSRCLCSKHLGASTSKEIDFIRGCIDRSKIDSTGLKFYDPNGFPRPLSKYYRKFVKEIPGVMSVRASGGPIYDDTRSIDDKLHSIEKGKVILNKIYQRDSSELFPII